MYKIIVEKLTEVEGKNYDDREEIYVQKMEEINLKNIIDAVNIKGKD